jgi:hypothetical protein
MILQFSGKLFDCDYLTKTIKNPRAVDDSINRRNLEMLLPALSAMFFAMSNMGPCKANHGFTRAHCLERRSRKSERH